MNADSSPAAPRPGTGTGTAAGSRDNPRRWWALAALVVSVLVLGFDVTILNVALPTMAADLGATTGQLQWIVDAFLVVFAALMLPAGLLGDRFGRRLMLIAGLLVLLAGSLLGVLAGSPGEVIAARTVMGVGAAFVAPLAVAVLPALFGPEERGKAVAAVTAGLAAGMPLGPLIGGWLLDHYWWGSVFLVNVPLVALGTAACLLLLPETRDRNTPRVDALSGLFTVTGLAALVYGLIEGPGRGWDDPRVSGALALSVPLLAGLVLRERRREQPMLDLKLLADRAFRWNALTATLITLVLTGLLFLLPQYLQTVLGYDAFGTGLRLMPMMAGLLVAARASQPLVARFGARGMVVTGLVLLAFASFLAASTTVESGYMPTAVWLSVTGLGVGLALVPAMDAALGALPPDVSGRGSGLLMTLRQTGGAIGVALLGSVLAQTYAGRVDTAGLPAAAAEAARESVMSAHRVAELGGGPALAASADRAFVDGMVLVMALSGAVALLAALLAAVLLPRGAAPPA
ncbi:DHA2 family efflux MFS transporter permease subunit, partial [Streptomyces sp. YIM 98790]|uniref:DHA2 family efflux MFS transporter permease subunit n=1 Tax=Streptomyces sp. YIM 98790 TaxID=2689077 RepID=UPI00140DCF9B